MYIYNKNKGSLYFMNLSNKKNLILGLVIFMLIFGGITYHVYAIENLNQEIAETEEVVENLEQANINLSDQIKSKSTELEELESEYRHMGDELDTTQEELDAKEKEINDKQKEIEQLNRDLEAKLKREEADRILAETEKEIEKEENEKEQVATEKPKKSEPAVEEESTEAKVDNSTEDKSEILSEDKVAKSEQPSENEVETSSSKTKNTNIGTFKVTHYAVGDGLTPSTTTANGTEVANTIYSPEGYRIIAVDTSVIPMNTIVRVTINGNTFLAKASDTGSAINGKKIDLLVGSPSEARQKGLATATIEIVE